MAKHHEKKEHHKKEEKKASGGKVIKEHGVKMKKGGHVKEERGGKHVHVHIHHHTAGK